MTAPYRCSILRPLLAVLIAAFWLVPGLKAQTQNAAPSVCLPPDHAFLEGDKLLYCVKRVPLPRGPSESAESYAERRGEYLLRFTLVEDLIELQIAADAFRNSTKDLERSSDDLSMMKSRIDRLCRKNFCSSMKFSGFPRFVRTDDSGSLLQFVSVTAMRSIDDQASDRLDLAYSLRILQMLHAVELLRSMHPPTMASR
jgi:hypothetical protein